MKAMEKRFLGEKLSRVEQVELAVSEAVKAKPSYARSSYAAKFARRMRVAEARVRESGSRLAGLPYPPPLPRAVVNALCHGAGDERNRAMIERYRAAAKAAQRFVR